MNAISILSSIVSLSGSIRFPVSHVTSTPLLRAAEKLSMLKAPVAELPADPVPAPVPTWAKPLAYVQDAVNAVSERRAALGLPQPGTIENINKEVSKDVFLTNYFFTGLRADIAKGFSLMPAFSITHSLAIGSQYSPPYALGALFSHDRIMLQGNLESSGALSGRANLAWSPFNMSSARFQIADGQPAMVQLEHDWLGQDFSINLKSVNPSILEGGFTGAVVGSILQSLTPSLSLGLETVYSRQSPLYPPDSGVSYFGRYVTPSWIASAQLQASGSVTASFWRKLTDKSEAGIESTIGLGNQQAMLMGGAPTIQGSTVLGAKYEFRQSIFRGQVDNEGKASVLLERRVLPMLTMMFASEVDYAKNTTRMGLGVQIEASTEEVLEQHQRMIEEQQGAPL